MVNGVRRPARLAGAIARSVPAAQSLRQRTQRGEVSVPEMTPAPRTRFNGVVTPHRVVDARRFSLDDIRRIKAAVDGATVNDVVLAIVGGALRIYLTEKGELPAESLRAMVPISTRTEAQKGTAGNQVSAMVASLGTDVAEPAARLAAVRESTHRSKAFSEAVDAQALTAFSEMLPGALMVLGARAAAEFEMAQRAAPVVNTVVSNVPGPQHPLYFAGAKLVFFFGGAQIGSGMALLHGVTSYCGQVMVSAVSDREILPDPAHYASCLQRSFEELRAATA
jgi:WS/DGAT/MGAT family acyltransferase